MLDSTIMLNSSTAKTPWGFSFFKKVRTNLVSTRTLYSTHPPPYFHWNYNLDIKNTLRFHWNNIVSTKKQKRRNNITTNHYINLSSGVLF